MISETPSNGFTYLIFLKFETENIEQSRDEHLAALKCCVLVRGTELLLLYATDRTTYIFLHLTPPHSNPTPHIAHCHSVYGILWTCMYKDFLLSSNLGLGRLLLLRV